MSFLSPPVPRFSTMLRTCGDAEDLVECRRVHTLIHADKSRSSDILLANLLIEAYGKCGSIEEAERVFQGMLKPNIYTYICLIGVYAQSKNLVSAKLVFEFMPMWNPAACNSIMACCNRCCCFEGTKSVFDKMPEHDTFSWTCMVDAYARKGDLHGAFATFDAMPERTMVSWSTMLKAYAMAAEVRRTKSFFDSMPCRSITTWNTLIAAFARTGDLPGAKSAFDKAPEWNVVTWTTLLQLYADLGQVAEAKSLFDKMQVKNLVSWTCMIQAYIKVGDLESASYLFFHCMPRWNMVTSTAMIVAYACYGMLDDAKAIFDASLEESRDLVAWNAMLCAHAVNNDVLGARLTFQTMPERDAVSYTAMLQCLAQNGTLNTAVKMFRALVDRDLVAWNVLTSAFAHSGKREQAMEAFRTMSLDGLAYNRAAFTNALVALGHGGSVEESCRCLGSMTVDHGLEAGREQCHCLLNTLGRAGRIAEAEELLHVTADNAYSWGSILSAYEIHRVVEAANYAAAGLDEISSHESAAAYVTLSTIIAQ